MIQAQMGNFSSDSDQKPQEASPHPHRRGGGYLGVRNEAKWRLSELMLISLHPLKEENGIALSGCSIGHGGKRDV